MTTTDVHSLVMPGEIKVDANHTVYVPDYNWADIYKFNASSQISYDGTNPQNWDRSYINLSCDGCNLPTAFVMAYDVSPASVVEVGNQSDNNIYEYSPTVNGQEVFDGGSWLMGGMQRAGTGAPNNGDDGGNLFIGQTGQIAFDPLQQEWDYLARGYLFSNDLFQGSAANELSQFNLDGSLNMLVETNLQTNNDDLVVIGYANAVYSWNNDQGIYVYTCNSAGNCQVGNNYFLAMDNNAKMSNSQFGDYLMSKDTSGNVFIYNGNNGISAFAPEQNLGHFLIEVPSGFVISSMVWNLYNGASQLIIGGSLNGNPDVEECTISGSIPNLSCGNGNWTDFGSPFQNSHLYAVVGADNDALAGNTGNGTIYAVSNDGLEFAATQN